MLFNLEKRAFRKVICGIIYSLIVIFVAKLATISYEGTRVTITSKLSSNIIQMRISNLSKVYDITAKNSKEENSFIVSLGARLQYFIRMSYEDFGYEDFVSAVRDNMELFTELTKITEDMFNWCLKEKKFDIDRLNLVYSVCRINPNAIPNSYTGSIRIVPPQLYTEF